jgi:hypothetical protein
MESWTQSRVNAKASLDAFRHKEGRLVAFGCVGALSLVCGALGPLETVWRTRLRHLRSSRSTWQPYLVTVPHMLCAREQGMGG